MASPHRHEGFYEPIGSSRGLQSQQSHQNLHRVQSRHLETTFMPNNGLYTAEDHAQSNYGTGRYDTGRLGGNSGYSYESSGAQTWNPNSYGGATSFAAISTTGRMKQSRSRAALPQGWMDQAPPVPQINPLAGLGNLSLGPSPMRTETVNSDPTNEEDLIPTAIVIKNIPFAVKKEQLVQLMTDLNLPLPYAFNYHFDNGVFRGLAFANFTTPEETATVIEVLNHFDLQGRKLRVEYKKMLPLAERERIEREKRERRGQLEEQHRPVPVASIQQPMMSATSPVSSMGMGRGSKPDVDVDLNDPQTLQFYSQLLLFRDDLSREALIFPSTLSPQQRRIVHTLAHHMALAHVSRGTGEQRQVHVFRPPTNVGTMNSLSSSVIPTTVHPVESSQQRRGLARAITMDFTEARSEGLYSTMGRGTSSLLDVPTSPSGRPDLSRQNLRPAKSFADLRSFTPSPVPSSASFPAALGANLSRYAMEYGGNSVNSATPSLTPTATGNHQSSLSQSESMLVNGLGNMSLTGSLGGNLHGMSSLRDARAQFLERQQQVQQQQAHQAQQQQQALQNERDYQAQQRNAYGGLGQTSYDDSPTRENRSGNVVPLRQPKGPESGSVGFGRNLHHQSSTIGRSNGENLDVQSGVEIVVE